jgi:hypothetical protein
LSYTSKKLQRRRQDSNLQPAAPKACTPIGSRSCFVVGTKRPVDEGMVRTRFTFTE